MTSELQFHYRNLFDQYGDSAHAVQWSDEDTQAKRFRVLKEVSSDLGSVVDLGCGLGHFYDFLRRTGFKGSYLGIDFVNEFIKHNSTKYRAETSASFLHLDLRNSKYPTGYDTYVICGVFNNLMPDNEAFMCQVIQSAFHAARRQVAFNAMSTYVDFEAENLYYSDPTKVFDFCKRVLTRRVTLRHDYLVRDDRPPYEYTIYLYK